MAASRIKIIEEKSGAELEYKYNLFIKTVNKIHKTDIKIHPKSWVAVVYYD